MAGDDYTWTAQATGGFWAVPGNWSNLTTGATPAPAAPGPADTVVIDGQPADQFQLLAGPGEADGLGLLDDTAFEGSIATGVLIIGQDLIGATDVLAGGMLAVAADAEDAGNVEINGPGASLAVAGALTQADSSDAGGDVLVLNGGVVQAGAWEVAGDVYVDPTAVATVGPAATGAAGVVSVQAGATLTLDPLANIEGSIVDDGILATQTSSQSYHDVTVTGSVSGSGQVLIDGADAVTFGDPYALGDPVSGLSAITLADAAAASSANSLFIVHGLSATGPISVGAYDHLTVDGQVTNTGSITLGADATATFGIGGVSNPGAIAVGAGATATFGDDLTGSSTLTIATGGKVEIDANLSGLSGVALATGAELDFVNTGLSIGTDVNVPIDLAGDDVIDVAAGVVVAGPANAFDASDVIRNQGAALEAGGAIVTGAVWSAADGTLLLTVDGTQGSSVQLAGDYTGQQFLTVGIGEGLTDGETLIGLAAGSAALPAGGTVAGDSGDSFQLLTGTAAAASFSFTGNNALVGRASAASVTVGGTAANTLSTLLIEAGAALAASGTATIQTALEADGAGASFTVAGTLTVGGTSALPELAAVNGAVVQVGGIDLTGSTGARVVVDPTGSIEVGGAGGAAAGALTIDAGASLTSQTPNATIIGAVIDDGTLEVAAATAANTGSTLNLDGNLSGTGTVLIDQQRALTVSGDVTGISDIGVGASSSLMVRGNLVTAAALATGDSSSVSVVGATEDLQSITTGTSASLTLTGAVSGVGAIAIGASGSATFAANLSGAGTGAMLIGSHAKVTITGTVSGFSGIALDSGADLTLFGADQSVGIALTGSDVLTLGTGVPVSGAISGFDATDDLVNQDNSVAENGVVITAATYTATGAGGGTLALSSDGTVVDTLTLAGSYTNDFLTNAAGLAAGLTSITLPGAVETGLSDPTVTGGTGVSFTVLAGTGTTAGALTLLDNVAVVGSFSAGSIVVGNDTEAFSGSVLAVDIEAGASLTTIGSASVLTNAEIDGTGALLSVGALTLVGGNGASEILVVNGGRVQASSLTLTPSDNPFGLGIATVSVDPTSVMQIGSGAGSTAGAINIAGGATVTARGPLDYIGGQVIDNGTLAVGSATSSTILELYNPLSGSGQVDIADTAENQHDLNLDSGASGLSSITLGVGAGLHVEGTLTDIGAITTGQSSSVVVTNNTTTPGDVIGVGSVSEGAQASLTITGNLSGTGPLVVGAGATAEIDGTVSGLSGITLDAGASLTLLGGDVGVPIQMGADTTLTIGYNTTISGTISGFGFGDVIKVEGTAYGVFITGANATPTAGGLDSLLLTDDATLLNTLMLSGNFAGQQFISNAAGAGATSDIVVADVPCFVAGTRIATERGEVAVEALEIGDGVRTASGEAVPIRWIGHRRIDLARHPQPARVAPIRIRRDAVSDGVPCRDLLVSPDHAIYLDGVLVCARALVNGASIVRESGRADVTYFHVELDRHAVLFAEGLTAESYLDTGNRGIFGNAASPLVLHPDLSGETGQALREASSCAPFVDDPDVIRPIWQRLADRAGALGVVPPMVPTTDEPDLAVLANGRLLRPIRAPEGCHVFCLPPGMASLRLVSRAAAPSAIRPWVVDDRSLGVAVTEIVLRDQANLQPIPMDHPALADGWWDVEANGSRTWRWTNGNAVLPPLATDRACLLEIHVLAGGPYLLDDVATAERVAA